MPSFFLFLILGMAVIIGGHYFLCFSIIRFFPPARKHLFGLIFLATLLSVSFLVSMFLNSWTNNAITRSLYFLSGLWMGMSLYLMMAALIVWIIKLSAKIFGKKVSISNLAIILFTFAVALTLWGAWNARHPVVKNVSVNIPELPETWKGKKVVQISDVHIGILNRAEFAADVAEKVNAEKPEAVFITGDLYDHIDGQVDVPITLVNSIEAPRGIFFVTGNHDTYEDEDELLDDINRSKANYLDDKVVNIDGLYVIGISYPRRGEAKDIPKTLKELEPEFSGQPNILLYHSPVKIQELKNLGVNLMLSGHTHAGQVWPLQYIHRTIYGKYYRGLHAEDSFALYTTSGTGTWGPPFRTGNRPEIVSITLN